MLTQILKDSKYDLSIFDQKELKEFEKRIIVKNKKFYVTCIIREKEIVLKPEEVIRQLYLYKLINHYKYPKQRIEVEYLVHFGRETKRADIIIFDSERPDIPYILVELKKPKHKEGKEQLRSYCNATGAPIGVWTNGAQIEFYHRQDPNYFYNLMDIPFADESFSDFLNKRNRITILDLIVNDKLQDKTLKDVIEELEDEVLANAGVDVFEESFKLIFTKLFDEHESRADVAKLNNWLEFNEKKSLEDYPDKLKNKLRRLEFRNIGTEKEIKERIEKLFQEAQRKWQGIFIKGTKIELSYSHLAICISYLQDIKLFNSNLEIIDEAFEYLVNKDNKGEKGQYFTPRYVIDMCVKMLNPKYEEYMIDPAAGSCGFPVHTIFHVWRKLNPYEPHLFTTVEKSKEQVAYAREKVFAIDFDHRAVRVGRTLNLIAGDGETNVMRLNSLDYDRWNEERKEDSWYEVYGKGFRAFENLRQDKTEEKEKRNYKLFNFDVVMANPPFAGDVKDSRVITKYELGKKVVEDKDTKKLTKEKGWYEKQSRDILFVERCLELLKPGGRMAIVLPQGRFNNVSDRRLREYIAEHCRILAVIGLHPNTFKPHTGTKTSVLFVQKWDDKLCPKKDDYNIFFATQQVRGKDNSGDKEYLTDENGWVKDKFGHFIVKHDLYNHNKFTLDKGRVIDKGETEDGIAEAFEEFAIKEELSFF
jgi:type I restriction enzyme M protein